MKVMKGGKGREREGERERETERQTDSKIRIMSGVCMCMYMCVSFGGGLCTFGTVARAPPRSRGREPLALGGWGHRVWVPQIYRRLERPDATRAPDRTQLGRPKDSKGDVGVPTVLREVWVQASLEGVAGVQRLAALWVGGGMFSRTWRSLNGTSRLKTDSNWLVSSHLALSMRPPKKVPWPSSDVT